MIYFSTLGDNWLGNSLFQIAAITNLAIKNKDKISFPKWEYDQFFNVEYIVQNKYDNFSLNYRESNSFEFTEIPYVNGVNLWGYFQSEKYFVDNKDIVLNTLTPKLCNYLTPLKKYTSIHVRRGDYLRLAPEYNILEMDYYNKAMEAINSDKYIVFSDDMDWCKANFIGDKFEFSENKKNYEDLALMSMCDNNIIANSSFSWWGAYLNKNKNKKIVAPKQWYGIDNKKANANDLIPKTWIQI